MKRQIALLVMFEESEITILEQLSKEQLQEVQEAVTQSVRKQLVGLGLIEESKQLELNESETVSFVFGPD
jgi:hypothetical protein